MCATGNGFKQALKATVFGLALLGVGTTPSYAITIEDAIRQALGTNPDIGVLASNREAVDQELRQARGLYLPQIDIEAGVGGGNRDDSSTRARTGEDDNLFVRESRATLQQRLFDGFEAGATVERDMARVESAAGRVLENSEVLALDAIGAFLRVLRGRELVSLAERNLSIHLDILGSIQARLRGGGGSRADVSQTQTRVARSRATLTDNYNTLRDAEAEYTRIVGQFPNDLQPATTPSDSLPEDLETAVLLAGRNNLTTKIFEADVRTADAEVELSEVPLYPIFSLEAETEYNDGNTGLDTYEFNSQVMLRVRWNLFRGGIDRAARQEALSRLNESKNRRLQSHLDSEQEMRQSWFALEAARQSVVDLQSAVKFAKDTRDAYVKQFEVAQRTLLDVLDAENELFVSASELVTAKTNEQLASFRILAVSGVLMETLGIEPPAQARVKHKGWFAGLAD
jgi:adhesin transport system outer membrane protein